MTKIYNNMIEVIGRTPLVRLHKLAEHYSCQAEVLAKLDFMNPLSSTKDRIGKEMVEQAEADGLIEPGKSVLIEPTAGNTGIALAFVAAVKGYRMICVMPENMSEERRKMIRFLGAELELTPADKGMKFAMETAHRLADEIDGGIILDQFRNPANPQAHYQTTGQEIWEDSGGQVDMFVTGTGTGGVLTGTSRYLKERNSEIKIVGVEPENCPYLSKQESGPHKIQGIGNSLGFCPDTLDMSLIDRTFGVSDEDAFATARLAGSLEGIPAGISSGATLHAALTIGSEPAMKDKKIVVMCASSSERYLSTELFDNLGV